MTATGPQLRDLLRLSLREWRHHPGRHAAALMAVALGVALAFSVHLINRSALAEFAGAVRASQGQPDRTVRAADGRLDEKVYERLALAEGVTEASPVLEVDSYARRANGERLSIRVLGVDALRLASLAPALLPRPADGEDRLAMLDPSLVFLNATAKAQLGLADGDTLLVQAGPHWQPLRVAGWVAAGGPPLAVMDLAGAQATFGRLGDLSRIDLRLRPGTDAAALQPDLPPGSLLLAPDDGAQQVTQLSRAYRVNLTVLALVALFVGAFLVYSVIALSVAQRTPALALLGVLGLTAGERRRMVLAECALLGAAGSTVGLLLGGALAAAALRWLSGDLGGGYFPGIAPELQLDAASAIGFGLLGTASALVGGWVPARQAERLQPALALKGLGSLEAPSAPAWPGLSLLLGGVALAFLPPVGGLPVAAYASVACLLFGGVALVPAVIDALLAALPQPQGTLPLLALRRARWQRQTATAAVAGVVASLALSVALTVMVASFRDGVTDWLDGVLPADLYARSAASSSAANQAWLSPAMVVQAAALPGVTRLAASRNQRLQLAPGRPPVVLVARDLGVPGETLPLLAPPMIAAPGELGVYVSEAVVALYGAQPGDTLVLPLGDTPRPVRVLAVWRDYARQFGSITMDRADYLRLTGDTRVNDLALWLAPGTDGPALQEALRALMPDPSMLEFAATDELKALSLRIFDRSFAVTYYLQAVAIAVGLIGVAASLSAQVMARRKEFGLLSHLGLTRRQVLALVTGETAAWLVAGCLIGLALGLAVSVVLVHVVNPQSFHWTMALVVPGGRLALLAVSVLVAGLATAAFSARRAAGRAAVLSVKEDW